MIDKEFLDKLKPVEIDYIAEYLMYKLGKKLVESDKIDNYDEDITYLRATDLVLHPQVTIYSLLT